MNISSALIIGVSIIIGFAIDPITKDSPSEPDHNWIMVRGINGSGHAEPFFHSAAEWKLVNGRWMLGSSDIRVADIASAKVLYRLYNE